MLQASTKHAILSSRVRFTSHRCDVSSSSLLRLLLLLGLSPLEAWERAGKGQGTVRYWWIAGRHRLARAVIASIRCWRNSGLYRLKNTHQFGHGVSAVGRRVTQTDRSYQLTYVVRLTRSNDGHITDGLVSFCLHFYRCRTRCEQYFRSLLARLIYIVYYAIYQPHQSRKSDEKTHK